MRAAQVVRLEGPDGLEVREVPDPVPGPDEVLIFILAAGVSFPDLLLSYGRYQVRPELPFTPGVEVAGEVLAAPEDSGFKVGDYVMAYTGLGGFAEKVAVDRRWVFQAPEGLGSSGTTFLAAAGFVMNYQTAYFALHRRGGLRAGETVLVHGAAGGLGTALVQVAKAAGATVIGVASTPGKQQAAREAGADEAVPTEGFKDAVMLLTDGRGVDVVADVVGAAVFDDSIRSLAPEGRLLVLGFAGGVIPEVKVNRLLLRNVSVVGVGWGAFLDHDPELAAEIGRDLHRLVDEGRLDVHVSPAHIYGLENAGEALQAIESRSAYGKVVLEISA